MAERSWTPSSRLVHQHGPAIAALREKDGYDGKTFAELAGMSWSHLRNLESERRMASPRHLNRIARVLGVSLAAVSREPVNEHSEQVAM